MKWKKRSSAGFTLMEINLVLFLFGAGVIALLGIFPVGLRQAQSAVSDTVQVAFASKVFARLQADAAELCEPEVDSVTGDLSYGKSWKNWESLDAFKRALGLKSGVDLGGAKIYDTTDDAKKDEGRLLLDYPSEGGAIRYCLELIELKGYKRVPYTEKEASAPRYRAILWVVDSKHGRPKTTLPFVADFRFHAIFRESAAHATGGE